MKDKNEFEKYLKKENLSANTITSYQWTLDYFLTHYDSLTKANLLAYKGFLMENYKPKTVNLRICKRQVLSGKKWKLFSSSFWQIKSSTFWYSTRGIIRGIFY